MHWKLGQVVDDTQADLNKALEQAFDLQPAFLKPQQEAFSYTFRSEPQSTAAQRGADVIASFLNN